MLALGRGVRVLKSDANGLYALYKPAEVMSHPNDEKSSKFSLINAPYDYKNEVFMVAPRKGSPDAAPTPIWLIHRLDSATSGIILVSTNAAVAKAVKQQLKNRNVTKYYTSLVFSYMRPSHAQSRPAFMDQTLHWQDQLTKQTIDGKLRANSPVFDSYGEAETLAKVISYQGQPYRQIQGQSLPYSLMMMDLQPITGFMHQIRFQSARHNFPIVGDRTYGDFSSNKIFRANMSLHPMNYLDEKILTEDEWTAGHSVSEGQTDKYPHRNHFKRLFLHARRTELTYVLDNQRFEFNVDAPIPQIFHAAMQGNQ